MKTNPFQPLSPITVAMFIGRINEIQQLERSLFQTKNDNPTNFIIYGERGIGKTSLSMLVEAIGQGKINFFAPQMNFLVISISLTDRISELGLIRIIQNHLNRELSRVNKLSSFISNAWNFIQRIEVSGTKINSREESPIDDVIFDDFAYALSETVKEITTSDNGNIDGLLILIDEADKANQNLQLGAFLKKLTEFLYRENCRRVAIGLFGLDSLRDVLRLSHESSLRIFNELSLKKLSPKEIDDVINRCLERAKFVNDFETNITDEGRDYIKLFSEGYPHFIQQFGYSAFEVDDDDDIDKKDVLKGAFGPHGAIAQIGERYYRDNFYNKIQKDSYRAVLQIMAESSSEWVTKKRNK
jgi:Cdc6-like AAA superfamily ATPase